MRPMPECAVRRQLTPEDMRRESEAKGAPVEVHPGLSHHLCMCGNFHPNPGYVRTRTDQGWTWTNET